MAKFERFEDIDAWGKARELTRMVYSSSNNEFDSISEKATNASKMISGLISYLSQHF